MSRASMFLALALVGLAAQLAVLVVFLGLTDLLVTAVIVLLWIPGEAARVGIERWWPFALAAAGGVCFALPLFLSARERRLESLNA